MMEEVTKLVKDGFYIAEAEQRGQLFGWRLCVETKQRHRRCRWCRGHQAVHPCAITFGLARIKVGVEKSEFAPRAIHDAVGPHGIVPHGQRCWLKRDAVQTGG